MKKHNYFRKLIPVYAMILVTFILIGYFGSKAITVFSENSPVTGRTCIIIDPGHGGEDGGATSCNGVLESNINLEISLRLNDLLHLLGYDTYMIRTTDISIYKEGNSIAAKKVSDLKERVRIVNNTENALLISIHQNTFTDSRYSGAQVFYGTAVKSKDLAVLLQTTLISALNPTSNRQPKKADGVYLMQNIQCAGVLVECGFISNPEEAARLCDRDYQNKLCCVLAATVSNFLDRQEID